MSSYLNPHMDLNDLLAQARATRATVVGAAIAKGTRSLAAGIAGLFAHIRTAQKQRAAVAQLMAMDERMLQDIGLNRSLVPFVVAGSLKNKAADLYADVGVGVNDNDNGLRHAA